MDSPPPPPREPPRRSVREKGEKEPSVGDFTNCIVCLSVLVLANLVACGAVLLVLAGGTHHQPVACQCLAGAPSPYEPGPQDWAEVLASLRVLTEDVRQLRDKEDRPGASDECGLQCLHGAPAGDCRRCACAGSWSGALCDVCELPCGSGRRPTLACDGCELEPLKSAIQPPPIKGREEPGPGLGPQLAASLSTAQSLSPAQSLSATPREPLMSALPALSGRHAGGEKQGRIAPQLAIKSALPQRDGFKRPDDPAERGKRPAQPKRGTIPSENMGRGISPSHGGRIGEAILVYAEKYRPRDELSKLAPLLFVDHAPDSPESDPLPQPRSSGLLRSWDDWLAYRAETAEQSGKAASWPLVDASLTRPGCEDGSHCVVLTATVPMRTASLAWEGGDSRARGAELGAAKARKLLQAAFPEAWSSLSQPVNSLLAAVAGQAEPDRWALSRFVENFGTHVITSVAYGGVVRMAVHAPEIAGLDLAREAMEEWQWLVSGGGAPSAAYLLNRTAQVELLGGRAKRRDFAPGEHVPPSLAGPWRASVLDDPVPIAVGFEPVLDVLQHCLPRCAALADHIREGTAGADPKTAQRPPADSLAPRAEEADVVELIAVAEQNVTLQVTLLPARVGQPLLLGVEAGEHEGQQRQVHFEPLDASATSFEVTAGHLLPRRPYRFSLAHRESSGAQSALAPWTEWIVTE